MGYVEDVRFKKLNTTKRVSEENTTYIIMEGVNKMIHRIAGNDLPNYSVSQSKNIK